MSDAPLALSTAVPAVAVEDDGYEAICATMMESARGRRFLQEYARRNRNADTRLVLDAVERIEAVIRGEAPQPARQGLRAELVEIAKLTADARAEIAEKCAQALAASTLRGPHDHGIAKAAEVLQELDRRINALLEPGSDSPQAATDAAEARHGSTPPAFETPAPAADRETVAENLAAAEVDWVQAAEPLGERETRPVATAAAKLTDFLLAPLPPPVSRASTAIRLRQRRSSSCRGGGAGRSARRAQGDVRRGTDRAVHVTEDEDAELARRSLCTTVPPRPNRRQLRFRCWNGSRPRVRTAAVATAVAPRPSDQALPNAPPPAGEGATDAPSVSQRLEDMRIAIAALME